MWRGDENTLMPRAWHGHGWVGYVRWHGMEALPICHACIGHALAMLVEALLLACMRWVYMRQVHSVTAPWCQRCGMASAVCGIRREMASAVDGMRRWAGGMPCGAGMRWLELTWWEGAGVPLRAALRSAEEAHPR
jgi:hypothetical protein